MTDDTDADTDGNEHPTDEDGNPLVPEGVIRGINDLAEGRTASAADLDDATKF